MFIALQQASVVDRITSDGTELTQLPYPFFVDEKGNVGRQDFWRGRPRAVVGFQKDLARHRVDIFWKQVVENPDLAVGKYIVTVDDGGQMSVHMSAVESATKHDGELTR